MLRLVVGRVERSVGDGRGIPVSRDARGLAVVGLCLGVAQGATAGGDDEDLGDGSGRHARPDRP